MTCGSAGHWGSGGLVSRRGGKSIHCLSIPVILALFMSTQTKCYFLLHRVHDMLTAFNMQLEHLQPEIPHTVKRFSLKNASVLRPLSDKILPDVFNVVNEVKSHKSEVAAVQTSAFHCNRCHWFWIFMGFYKLWGCTNLLGCQHPDSMYLLTLSTNLITVVSLP